MGMTIDEVKEALEKERKYALHENKQAFDIAIDTMRKYQMMQADYENRLKADLVAMLTEILLEAEENTVRWYVGRVDGKSDDVVLMETINDIIQKKINSLKENTDGAISD